MCLLSRDATVALVKLMFYLSAQLMGAKYGAVMNVWMRQRDGSHVQSRPFARVVVTKSQFTQCQRKNLLFLYFGSTNQP